MEWLINLFTTTDSVAHIALLYAIVIAVGVFLGKIKIGGISLGVTFVLFAGIAAGHIGFTAPTNILSFIQDFGLILFVFMIGLQVGPGFFESFRKGGVTLNALSAVMILLNIIVMFICYYVFFDTSNPENLPMMVGTLYGAVTNTPGLGAANEALTTVFSNGNVPQIASGYACAYPLGVLGIIGATIAVKYICRIKLDSVFVVYTMTSIAKVFFITAGTFGAMAFYGYTTKKDLTSLGKILFMALIGLIIATIVNMFLKSSGFDYILSYAGVAIFVGLTAWDSQKIKQMLQTQYDMSEGAQKLALIGALTLYLDFINLFLYLLRIFGGSNKE